ncbi:hypothetical protein [Streptomyces sp. NPDC048419]|uniref:hypothetical protein n=1 Tax=Streptomyces sp. NPDC048419 TaxID=3365547 RepID=UPI003723516E
MEWITEDLMCTYEPLTVGAVLGPEAHWAHVFAVMKALAGRFGDDGVRLVAAFDWRPEPFTSRNATTQLGKPSTSALDRSAGCRWFGCS